MLLDNEIKSLEKNGHYSAAFTLRKWQEIINNPKKVYLMTTEKMADQITMLSTEDIAKRAISVIVFNWPETKEVLR